jgi:hypothetical integral membrane protein (TIGR02206 family)
MFFSEEATMTTSLFDLQHILALIVFIILVVVIFKSSSRLKTWKNKNHLRITLGIVLLLLDIGFYVWKWAVGNQLMFPIPMHICSWATYIVALALITNNNSIFQVSLYYGFTGGVLSLLVPDFGGYGINHFRFHQFFLLHMMLILGPLLMLKVYEHKCERKYLWVTVIIMSIQAFIAYPVNLLVENVTGEETNMMFVMEAPAEIKGILPGHPYYIFIVAVFFIIYWNIIYKMVEKKHP